MAISLEVVFHDVDSLFVDKVRVEDLTETNKEKLILTLREMTCVCVGGGKVEGRERLSERRKCG